MADLLNSKYTKVNFVNTGLSQEQVDALDEHWMCINGFAQYMDQPQDNFTPCVHLMFIDDVGSLVHNALQELRNKKSFDIKLTYYHKNAIDISRVITIPQCSISVLHYSPVSCDGGDLNISVNINYNYHF